MSAPGSGIDERDLHAWVDDRLDADVRDRVGARIAADPVLAAQAEHLRRQNTALRALFAPELERPVPPRLRAAASGAAAANRPWFRQAAGLAIAASIGIGVGWTARDQRVGTPAPASAIVTAPAGDSGLLRAATVAHAAYAPEVRHPVEVAASEHAHLVAWLSRRLDAPLKVPDLSSEGYPLIGGRLLPDDTGGVAAQFMFESSRGQRLTLFMRRDPRSTDTAFRYARQGDIGSFYWIDHGFGYALSGELSRDAMLSVATAVYRQINP